MVTLTDLHGYQDFLCLPFFIRNLRFKQKMSIENSAQLERIRGLQSPMRNDGHFLHLPPLPCASHSDSDRCDFTPAVAVARSNDLRMETGPVSTTLYLVSFVFKLEDDMPGCFFSLLHSSFVPLTPVCLACQL